MTARIACIQLVVPDYESALQFYCGVLGFHVVEDTELPDEDKRWITVQPNGGSPALVLGRARDAEQQAAIGNQAGGRVFLFLATDDFERDYQRLVKRGVPFIRLPTDHDYGRVAVFRDPFGNLWDLVQFSPGHPFAV